MSIYHQQGNWNGFDRVVTEASAYVEKELQKREVARDADSYLLSWVAHDVGARLMWAQRYEQATHFLQTAIHVQDANANTHFFLAICIWANEKDRKLALHHLKIAQGFVNNPLNRGRFYNLFFGNA